MAIAEYRDIYVLPMMSLSAVSSFQFRSLRMSTSGIVTIDQKTQGGEVEKLYTWCARSADL